jgi:Icc-related predicted phosphoesterase
MFRRRTRRANGSAERTLYFATDLHGSEVCFRKFIAAAKFYGADLLILGGDLTGKLVVPLVELDDGKLLAELHGEEVTVDVTEVEDFERRIADEGLYAARMTQTEHQRLSADPDAVDELFLELMLERLRAWCDYAQERLEGTDISVITTPGNDDPPEIDQVIRDYGGGRVLLMEGEIYEAAPGVEMLNTGYSNETPWKTPREFPEQVVREHIEEMTARLRDPSAAIFNIHVPPYDSGLDTAPLLDENLVVRTSMGAQLSAPVGSTAVREALETHQPVVSLHGHIHESGGTARIGRTVAINPGSEYSEGVLRGALVTFADGRLVRHQATSG